VWRVDLRAGVEGAVVVSVDLRMCVFVMRWVEGSGGCGEASGRLERLSGPLGGACQRFVYGFGVEWALYRHILKASRDPLVLLTIISPLQPSPIRSLTPELRTHSLVGA